MIDKDDETVVPIGGKGNGKMLDEGLIAINEAFRGAKYLEEAAKECAELMKIGKHRDLEISDGVAMNMYAMITEGKKFEMTRRGSTGAGYQLNVENYTDLAELFRGDLLADQVGPEPEAANDE